MFHYIGHSQLTISRIWSYNANKSITINVFVDSLEINKTNTIRVISATAKTDKGQILISQEAYPDRYFSNSDGWVQINLESQSNPIYKLDSLKVKVKYFTPTVENKSLITINNPQEKLHLSLIENEYPALKFIVLDFLTLKQLKRKSKKDYNALIETIEERNKTQKGKLAWLMDVAFKDYKGFSKSELQKRIFIYMEDKERVIKKVSTFNNNGKEMDKVTSNLFDNSFSSLIQVKGYFEIPQNDWTFKLFIENEKSTKEIELKMGTILIPENKTITH